ncbi:MAG: DUF4276 family protein [Nitrospinota bacterium]|nr:DUF4276 family protein [Nitrospinota bacterium]MDH5677270.1 DUF4276 family protein [Nitrospinota bacterium]
MKISIIVEGETEKAFKLHLVKFLESRLSGNMPSLKFDVHRGSIPTNDKLRRVVQILLRGKQPADHVIALTDVYTGDEPPIFKDASEAKRKMTQWVGPEPRFHPHAAQHDFEAWLLPYWNDILKLAGHKSKKVPAVNPETVNHTKPPAFHIKEVFRNGGRRGQYSKPRDAGRILRENDLSVAIRQCSELKAFVNTILHVCGAQKI